MGQLKQNPFGEIDRYFLEQQTYHFKIFPSLQQAKGFLPLISLFLLEVLVNEKIIHQCL